MPDGPTDRPNVLLVCTDQQFAGAMSCAGTDHVDTPAMDRLAARGVRFPETYCANPVCGPSRACMFSGEPTHENGVVENGDGFDGAVRERTLGRLLSAAGYDCAYGGKWHVPEMAIPEDHGFERVCGFNDHRVPEASAEYLRRDHDDPFFLVASFDNPHNICEWSRDQTLPWGSVDVPPVEECPPLPANYSVAPYEPLSVAESRETETMYNVADPGDWRQYRYAYYRLIERVDDALGRILDVLDEEGLADETVVVFTSDHGDMHGAHRLQQKWVTYEESVRVPLIVAGPETADGHTDDRLVSNGYDLVPTLCDYAGVEPPDGLPGDSLREPARGARPDDWRDALVTESTVHLDARMVRTERYKYAVYGRGKPREQLFDLETDRGEMVNLAVDAGHRDVLDRHRELLLEWCIDTDDRFMSHYGDGISDLPTVPGFEYEAIEARVERARDEQ